MVKSKIFCPLCKVFLKLRKKEIHRILWRKTNKGTKSTSLDFQMQGQRGL